ncbi:MAG: carbon-phosphorus lyase complex subunit PhnI [Spirochaetales bacterium]|nr:carbon-phosphorus lyase complex subunit PhnI [Spirochaetales bacterium]
MGYVAVQGGETAIRNADALAAYLRVNGTSQVLTRQQIEDQLKLLVDRVMGEGSLYSTYHAALAIKQAEGDPVEAGFIIRAYRSTLPRIAVSEYWHREDEQILRRISSAFKDIPGGQILGSTNDYRQRILDFGLDAETEDAVRRSAESYLQSFASVQKNDVPQSESVYPKVVELLQKEGLIRQYAAVEIDPAIDVTRESVSFPLHRSGRLQLMARSETGSILALAYSSMRGYGSIHPTIAELRVASVPLVISHPYRREETVYCGTVTITETEVLAKFDNDNEEGRASFTLGYGCCFGVNEVKAISMAVLDRCMKSKEKHAPAEDQEFVLSHIDGIESSGFCAHFKLPHYITFQAELDRVREAIKEESHVNA